MLEQQRKALGQKAGVCGDAAMTSLFQVAGNIRRLCASVGKNRMVLDKNSQK